MDLVVFLSLSKVAMASAAVVVGTASSVRSCVAMKVYCFEAVPERQFSIPFSRT